MSVEVIVGGVRAACQASVTVAVLVDAGARRLQPQPRRWPWKLTKTSYKHLDIEIRRSPSTESLHTFTEVTFNVFMYTKIHMYMFKNVNLLRNIAITMLIFKIMQMRTCLNHRHP